MTTGYHEPTSELSKSARDVHRALATLIEELEAVDWYHQRVDVTEDEDLKQVLLHHRNDEIEHAAMALEWLRRIIPEFDEELRTFLFTSDRIVEVHEKEGTEEGPSAGDLGIRKLKSGD